MTNNDDETGFNVVPKRYQTENGREAIDILRDDVSDHEFTIYCRLQRKRYELRLGKKGPHDDEKIRFYTEMFDHMTKGTPDPRHNRADFELYRRAAFPSPMPEQRIDVLDHGFVRFVESWGGGDVRMPEAGIIEAARQSTQGSFRGWKSDRKLLTYLHEHKHSTPFEFAGMVLEVRAPIFVFREWHRHRTQVFNEMSARYTPLPDLNYMPTIDRLMCTAPGTRQAAPIEGAAVLTRAEAVRFQTNLYRQYSEFEREYQRALMSGVPKELARCGMNVGRYSQMRVHTCLRNWLGFMTLRLDPAAQWEIRQYAQAVLKLSFKHFPETTKLFRGAL